MSALRLPKILNVKVRDLKPWGLNPRVHGQAQLERLGKSLEQFGLARLPVVQAGTLRILAGHGLHQTLMDGGHGAEVIPVIAVELCDEEAAAYTLADNRLGELSAWNIFDLRDSLGDLDNGVRDMLALGWSDEELLKVFGMPIEALKAPEDLAGEDEEIPEAYLVEVTATTAAVTGPDKKMAKKIQTALEAAGWGKA